MSKSSLVKKPPVGSLLPVQTIIAYHGGSAPIRRFNKRFSAQGVFWFSEDKDKILRGESGADSVRYLIKVALTVRKIAGWEEYDRYSLGELDGRGYDSAHLDDDWFVFEPSQIKVLEIVDLKRPRR